MHFFSHCWIRNSKSWFDVTKRIMIKNWMSTTTMHMQKRNNSLEPQFTLFYYWSTIIDTITWNLMHKRHIGQVKIQNILYKLIEVKLLKIFEMRIIEESTHMHLHFSFIFLNKKNLAIPRYSCIHGLMCLLRGKKQ